MKNLRVLLLTALAVVLSGCSLFGGDDTAVETSTAETFTPEPTMNVVQAAPADAAVAQPTLAAAAPLPTAMAIPATPTPTPDRSQPTSYVVQSGDVLGLIAQEFGVDIAELRRVNDLSGNLIRVGQTLTIPALESSSLASTAPADGSDESASAPVGSTSSPTPAPKPTPVSCGSTAVGHCVQSGDSLLGIASTYGVSVDSLRAANPSITGDTIRIGDLLTLPGGTSGTTGTDTSTDTGSTDPAPTVGAQSDQDCEARNPGYPYFHQADGLCYANPIGGPTAIPTSVGADADGVCVKGKFLWEDGLCYAIAGYTPEPEPTPTGSVIGVDYGRPPCDDWEVELETNQCWPSNDATAAQIEEGRVKDDS